MITREPRAREVHVPTRPVDRFAELLEPAVYSGWRDVLHTTAEALRGRVVWHLNSTARGGGVAEMMGPLIGYARDVGADARWVVIAGTPSFFAITKRLHNLLHGDPGDGGTLGPAERAVYDRVLRANALELAAVVRPGDIAVLHDPQTAGLLLPLRRRGATVVWRCHIGYEDTADARVVEGWRFLAPYIEHAHVTVFSRQVYVPDCCRAGTVRVMQPSIDPFSPKNQDMDEAQVRAILVQTGIVEGAPDGQGAVFLRDDGAPGRVDRGADILRVGRGPQWDTPLVVQVSRWDRLKDPIGVLTGFARLDEADARGARLVLAGPAVTAVADDPDGPAVLGEVTAAWRALPHQTRRRIQLVSLPMVDPQENAAIVNALQRHAAVVVQKSLREGFGLTVTEAMWKGRPVVASAVGGITDQITDGRTGVLVADATDPGAFAAALRGVLTDPDGARRMGEAARERVRADFLSIRQLVDYANLVRELL